MCNQIVDYEDNKDADEDQRRMTLIVILLFAFGLVVLGVGAWLLT